MKAPAKEYDSRVCVSTKDLIALRSLAKGFAANPRAAINNQFVGRHYSSQRGRGLNFEELSHYRIGDDIRTMDWKVSNRTGKPHVRVFTEERERPIMLACDQRQSMFFGSQHKMKSVVAAETMALLAWRHIALGDAVASLLFADNNREFDSKPLRSSQRLLQDFQRLGELNQSLVLEPKNTATLEQRRASLHRVLTRLNTLCAHDYVIVLISDLYGFDQHSGLLLKSLSLHNDVIVTHIADPAEYELPPNRQFIASNGQQQLAINTRDKKLAQRYAASRAQHQEHIRSVCRSTAVPLVSLNTIETTHNQLRTGLPEIKSDTNVLRNSRGQ